MSIIMNNHRMTITFEIDGQNTIENLQKEPTKSKLDGKKVQDTQKSGLKPDDKKNQ